MSPLRARRPCLVPTCPELAVERGRCRRHASQAERARGRPVDRGYGARWRRARESFLFANPLCARCLDLGRRTPSSTVDHIVPHRGDLELFWSERNWQALCKPCHDRKTGGGE